MCFIAFLPSAVLYGRIRHDLLIIYSAIISHIRSIVNQKKYAARVFLPGNAAEGALLSDIFRKFKIFFLLILTFFKIYITIAVVTITKFIMNGECKMEENIIMLEDDNGNQIEFEAIDVFEFNGNTYFVLLEIMDEGEENDEVLIMKVDDPESEEPQLVMVEDEEELQAAFDEFVRRDEEAADEE